MATGLAAVAADVGFAVEGVDVTPPPRPPPRVMALAYEENLRLHRECSLHLRENRVGDFVPDFEFVSEHSIPHRSLNAARAAWNNGSPPSHPARRGRRPFARNEPHEMVRRIWAIYHGTPHEDRTQVWRRVNAVRGEEKISWSAFLAKYDAVLVMLNAVPRIRFLQPTEEDADGVIARMLNVSMNGVIRVGSYALTYRPIVDALIWLRINRPDVTMNTIDTGVGPTTKR